MSNLLPLGMSQTPPSSPWGINFGGGLNSTALIIECRNRGYRPDWILFADTGSEIPGTLEHVERMQQWCDDKRGNQIPWRNMGQAKRRGTFEERKTEGILKDIAKAAADDAELARRKKAHWDSMTLKQRRNYLEMIGVLAGIGALRP